LAYAALVQSAGSSGSDLGDALAWFCVQSLLDAAKSADMNEGSNRAQNAANEVVDGEHVHRLHLTLISALPSLPLKLLPRGLEEMKSFIVSEIDEERKKELVDAVLKETLERVGDQEKVIVMSWLLDNSDSFRGDRTGDTKFAPML
jgi:hypothetical protein